MNYYEDDDLNLPKRQSKVIGSLNTDGPWHEAGHSIYKRVGTGFLVALVGIKGTGKTQIGCNILSQSKSAHKIVGLYLKAMDFFLAIKATYRKESEQSEEDVIKAFARRRLLVLDALEERGQTEWEDRLLRHLIDTRYDAMRDTLLISNETLSAFSNAVGDAVMSRLNESGGIVLCDWPSFRK